MKLFSANPLEEATSLDKIGSPVNENGDASEKRINELREECLKTILEIDALTKKRTATFNKKAKPHAKLNVDDLVQPFYIHKGHPPGIFVEAAARRKLAGLKDNAAKNFAAADQISALNILLEHTNYPYTSISFAAKWGRFAMSIVKAKELDRVKIAMLTGNSQCCAKDALGERRYSVWRWMLGKSNHQLIFKLLMEDNFRGFKKLLAQENRDECIYAYKYICTNPLRTAENSKEPLNIQLLKSLPADTLEVLDKTPEASACYVWLQELYEEFAVSIPELTVEEQQNIDSTTRSLSVFECSLRVTSPYESGSQRYHRAGSDSTRPYYDPHGGIMSSPISEGNELAELDEFDDRHPRLQINTRAVSISDKSEVHRFSMASNASNASDVSRPTLDRDVSSKNPQHKSQSMSRPKTMLVHRGSISELGDPKSRRGSTPNFNVSLGNRERRKSITMHGMSRSNSVRSIISRFSLSRYSTSGSSRKSSTHSRVSLGGLSRKSSDQDRFSFDELTRPGSITVHHVSRKSSTQSNSRGAGPDYSRPTSFTFYQDVVPKDGFVKSTDGKKNTTHNRRGSTIVHLRLFYF